MIEKYYYESLNRLSNTVLNERYKREDESWMFVNDTLGQWKDIYYYKKNNISLFSKYYIVNKKKIDCSNIQENVREKIEQLNRIHQNNRYFFHLSQSLIENNNNKHNYNNFDISLIEYEYITLYDIIINNEYIMKLNLPYTYINDIMIKISSFIKNNKKRLSEVDRENMMVHHTALIESIVNLINCKIDNIFSGPAPAQLIKNYISGTSFKSSSIVNLNDVFYELPESSRKEISNSLVALELPHDVKWVMTTPSI